MNYQEFKQAVIAVAKEKEVKDYELFYSESAETQTEIFKEEVKGFTDVIKISDVQIRGKANKMDIYEVLRLT